VLTLTLGETVSRARHLVEQGPGRVILGITGAPGCGKSTLTRALIAGIPDSVCVGMDGYHLAHSTLAGRGDAEFKGAIQTFDAAGYVALLQRIRTGEPGTIWAPEFRREIEDPIAGAIGVEPRHRLVVTEGNYLLADDPPWDRVASLCDEVWYLDIPDARRVAWLVRRHMRYGRRMADARERATTGTDGRNALLVEATKQRADAFVTMG